MKRGTKIVIALCGAVVFAGVAYMMVHEIAGPLSRSPAGAAASEAIVRRRIKMMNPVARPSEIDAIMRRYRDIVTALPTASTTGPRFDTYQSWANWVTSESPDAAMDAGEIVAILNEPVRVPGDSIIEQVFDTTIGSITSTATCADDGSPVIAYDPLRLAALTPPALRFIKAHETAHFVKHHFTCGPHPATRSDYTEREADCWAVDMLNTQGASGQRAIAAAAQYFKDLHLQRQGVYESSDSRASYINHDCRTG